MINKQAIIKFFTADIAFKDNSSYRRVILINAILLLTTFVFFVFAYINYYVILDKTIAVFDIFSAILSLGALIYLRISKIIKYAALIATFNLFTFFLMFVYFNQNNHFGIIWTIFLPIFAIIINGRRIGLYFSIVFYAILLPYAYSGIGVWQDGYWNQIDFIRLSFASLVLTFIMYMNEFSLEKSDEVLAKIRIREKDHIEKLKNISITDSLTKLYNRRHFNELASKILRRVRRDNEYMTLFMIDIDFFKDYNDLYGHQKGDEVLKKVSSAIKEHMHRYNDYIFRVGGEEFAGIIQSSDSKESRAWIYDLCNVVESLQIIHEHSRVSNVITISIGVKTVKAGDYDTVDKLYREADEALYLAKEAGRNQVKFA